MAYQTRAGALEGHLLLHLSRGVIEQRAAGPHLDPQSRVLKGHRVKGQVHPPVVQVVAALQHAQQHARGATSAMHAEGQPGECGSAADTFSHHSSLPASSSWLSKQLVSRTRCVSGLPG